MATSVCVYPLSPSYLPLHRYLYYLSLSISVLYPTPPPLVKGAFAFSLTYSSTASLYTFLIAGIHAPNHIINLDIFALWAILSTASIVVLPMMQWSKNLQGTGSGGARPIIRIWGVLVIASTICVYVLLLKAKGAVEQVHIEDSGKEICWSGFSKPKLLLRNPEDVLLAANDVVFGKVYGWVVRRVAGLVFLPAGFGLISCLVTILPNPVRNIDHEDRSPLGDFPTLAAGNTFSFWSAARNGFVHLRNAVVALTPLLFIPTLVLNEYYLFQKSNEGIPEGEKIYEIGQWGIFVGAGFIAAAALINSIVGKAKTKEGEIGDLSSYNV